MEDESDVERRRVRERLEQARRTQTLGGIVSTTVGIVGKTGKSVAGHVEKTVKKVLDIDEEEDEEEEQGPPLSKMEQVRMRYGRTGSIQRAGRGYPQARGGDEDVEDDGGNRGARAGAVGRQTRNLRGMMEESKQILEERQERLGRVQRRTRDMGSDGEDFAAAARSLRDAHARTTRRKMYE